MPAWKVRLHWRDPIKNRSLCGKVEHPTAAQLAPSLLEVTCANCVIPLLFRGQLSLEQADAMPIQLYLPKSLCKKLGVPYRGKRS